MGNEGVINETQPEVTVSIKASQFLDSVREVYYALEAPVNEKTPSRLPKFTSLEFRNEGLMLVASNGNQLGATILSGIHLPISREVLIDGKGLKKFCFEFNTRTPFDPKKEIAVQLFSNKIVLGSTVFEREFALNPAKLPEYPSWQDLIRGILVGDIKIMAEDLSKVLSDDITEPFVFLAGIAYANKGLILTSETPFKRSAINAFGSFGRGDDGNFTPIPRRRYKKEDLLQLSNPPFMVTRLKYNTTKDCLVCHTGIGGNIHIVFPSPV